MTKTLRAIGLALCLPAFVLLAGCATEAPQNDNANRSTAAQPASEPVAVVTPGGIEIVSTPPGARVLLIASEGGRPIPRGLTPTTLNDVSPGKYTVHLEYPGYRFFQKEVEVKAGETVKVEARMQKE